MSSFYKQSCNGRALIRRRSLASLSPQLNVLGQVNEADANRVADAYMREVATLAEAVHDRAAYAELLGDLANRKQRLKGTPAGKML